MALSEGTLVSWSASGGTAYGRIDAVVTDGEVSAQPEGPTMAGTEEEPACAVAVMDESGGEWEETDQVVVHRADALTELEALPEEKAEAEGESKGDPVAALFKATEDEINERYDEVHDATNMTASEIEAWGETECCDAAGDAPGEARRRVIGVLRTDKDDWTDSTYEQAGRVLSFISRHRGQSGGDPAQEGCPSAHVISLKNWGYDPTKSKEAPAVHTTERKDDSRPAYKSVSGTVKNVDAESRTVAGYFSTFGNVDSDGDIIPKGLYKHTIDTVGPQAQNRFWHLDNHNPTARLGKPHVLREDAKGLYFETTFPETPLANEVLAHYKAGNITEHSIMLDQIKRESEDKRVITGALSLEGSTVTWGANADTPAVGLKSYQRTLEKLLDLSGIADQQREVAKRLEAIERLLKEQPDEMSTGDALLRELANG